MSLKIQYSWNNPNLECFCLVIQLGSTDMNDIFGLAGTVVTWDSKLTTTHRPLWLDGVAKILKLSYPFKISPLLADLCYMLKVI